ncbi:MAG: hypothetical protein A2Z25_00330 [Planctomycetes bacterium RBG_16_55_9]|nr:MAG: hypothetical protein A2Z25_00330 [Planctomycetes bacterium RBG_16_55_9]
MFIQVKAILLWRVPMSIGIALVLYRWQACPELVERNASGTQGRDGLATNDHRDEAATRSLLCHFDRAQRAEKSGREAKTRLIPGQMSRLRYAEPALSAAEWARHDTTRA